MNNKQGNMTLRPPRERNKPNKYDIEDYFTPNNTELENIEKTIMTEKLTQDSSGIKNHAKGQSGRNINRNAREINKKKFLNDEEFQQSVQIFVEHIFEINKYYKEIKKKGLNKNAKQKKLNKSENSKEQDIDELKKKVKNNYDGQSSQSDSNVRIEEKKYNYEKNNQNIAKYDGKQKIKESDNNNFLLKFMNVNLLNIDILTQSTNFNQQQQLNFINPDIINELIRDIQQQPPVAMNMQQFLPAFLNHLQNDSQQQYQQKNFNQFQNDSNLNIDFIIRAQQSPYNYMFSSNNNFLTNGVQQSLNNLMFNNKSLVQNNQTIQTPPKFVSLQGNITEMISQGVLKTKIKGQEQSFTQEIPYRRSATHIAGAYFILFSKNQIKEKQQEEFKNFQQNNIKFYQQDSIQSIQSQDSVINISSQGPKSSLEVELCENDIYINQSYRQENEAILNQKINMQQKNILNQNYQIKEKTYDSSEKIISNGQSQHYLNENEL